MFEGGGFDFVYIDGSHLATDVLEDAVLTFRLVDGGGSIVFDDYDWGQDLDEELRPKPAIDVFLRVFRHRYELLH